MSITRTAFTGEYPPDWKSIARRVKDACGWKCVRCQHPHDPAAGRTLTIHHLNGQKDCNRWWNLCPLCQACHLHIQGKVRMERVWMFDHSGWFRPYVAGYYAASFGLDDSEAFVLSHIDEMIALGQGRIAREEVVAA